MREVEYKEDNILVEVGMLECLQLLPYILKLTNLQEIKLHWRFATEDGDQHFDFAFFFVDVVDRTQKVSKWSIHNFDGFANREGSLVFGCFHLHKFQNRFDFFFRDRSGLVASADESGD